MLVRRARVHSAAGLVQWGKRHRLWRGCEMLGWRPLGQTCNGQSQSIHGSAPLPGHLGSNHLPETFKATTKDVFGFRQRVTALFGEPMWLSMAETRENCQKLPIASKTPLEFLAALLFPLLLWSVKNGTLLYTADATDGARDLADANFDGHVALQKESFLRPGLHEDARYHGKLRTKFDRATLATHLLSAICSSFCAFVDADPGVNNIVAKQNWCTDFSVPATICKATVQFSYTFADHSEAVWKILDFASKNHELPQEDEDAAEPPQVLAPLVPAGPVNLIALPPTWIKADQWFNGKDLDTNMRASHADIKTFVSALPLPDGFNAKMLKAIMVSLLQCPGRWFYWGQGEAQKRAIKRHLGANAKKKACLYAFLASLVLRALGLGALVKTVAQAGGGRANYFFLKRPVTAPLHKVLAFFNYTDQSAPSLQAYAAQVSNCTLKPSRAPRFDSVEFPPLPGPEDLGHLLDVLRPPAADEDHLAEPAAPNAEALALLDGPPEVVAQEEAVAGGFGV